MFLLLQVGEVEELISFCAFDSTNNISSRYYWNVLSHCMHLLVVFVSFLFTLHLSFFLLYLYHLQNAFIQMTDFLTRKQRRTIQTSTVQLVG